LPNENKHAPNEWLDLANYRRGMEAIARLWIGLGELHAKRSSS
jgi:acetylornithine deacetylase/succinyl-diaminopimelate desuccinylase-like protein